MHKQVASLLNSYSSFSVYCFTVVTNNPVEIALCQLASTFAAVASRHKLQATCAHRSNQSSSSKPRKFRRVQGVSTWDAITTSIKKRRKEKKSMS